MTDSLISHFNEKWIFDYLARENLYPIIGILVIKNIIIFFSQSQDALPSTNQSSYTKQQIPNRMGLLLLRSDNNLCFPIPTSRQCQERNLRE